ncbi:hypothetical protein [Sphingomonas sp. 2SG]|uniref:hypothetical protein n=1 Tax=Sphingomonas sp. 2SG TaxID=2502201 RepID=UPI001BB165B2|nr:hypothetical protein [Sphingomonas sp. 2SG]
MIASKALMTSGKVNKRTVDALKPGTGVGLLWDDELKGFGVKITPAGRSQHLPVPDGRP